MSDPICDPNTNNLQTTFRAITSQNSTITDLYPFLCEVLQWVGIEDVDTVLFDDTNSIASFLQIDNFPTFDAWFENLKNSGILNFNAYNDVGDPRISLGAILNQVFREIFPIAITEVEVIKNGGCQVIDGFICDSDGRKKKQLQFNCPANYTPGMINAEYIVQRTQELITAAFNAHAVRFANFIRNSGPTLHYYTNYNMFYARLSNGAYLKYFPDTRNIVASTLGIGITNRGDSSFDNGSHYQVMVNPIGNY